MDCVKFLWNNKLKILFITITIAGIMILLSSDQYHNRIIRILPVVIVLYFGLYLFQQSRKYSLVATLLITLLTSPVIILLLTKQKLVFLQFLNTFVFAAGISCIITALASIFSRNKISMAIFSVLPAGIVGIAAIIWGYYFSANSWVTHEVLLALAQTNVTESIEWVKDQATFGAFCAIVLAFIVTSVLIKGLRCLKLDDKHKNWLLLLFVILGISCLYMGRKNIYYTSVVNAKNYLTNYEQFKKLSEKRKNSLTTDYKVIGNNKKSGIYVLVIGESQNKDHMQAYGYNRQTTPWLNEMAKKENTLLMQKAFSCHTHTVPVITYALTSQNQYNNIPLEKAISIIDVAKIAGFNTAWLSNQVQYGAWDTPNTIIATSADQQIWINKNVGKTLDTNSYDEYLAEQVKKLKLHDKMLIVFHLMGNHGQYIERYPKSFAKFTGKNNIDTYDNSILYNDYVVKKIYETCSSLPNFKGMIYCADHADAVKENLWHDAGRFVYPMTHIPFYAIFSDDYVRENRDKIAVLKAHRNTVITNDLLFDTVNSLMGLKVEGVYTEVNDILSDSYDGNIDRFTTLYGKRKIKDDPVLK